MSHVVISFVSMFDLMKAVNVSISLVKWQSGRCLKSSGGLYSLALSSFRANCGSFASVMDAVNLNGGFVKIIIVHFDEDG